MTDEPSGISGRFDHLGDADFHTWFLGVSARLSRVEWSELCRGYHRVVEDPAGVVLLRFDPGPGVAELHLYIRPAFRGPAVARRLLARAEAESRAMGMRKMFAVLTEGNPYLNPGRKKRLGYELEGVLRQHVFVAGRLRDAYLYSKFL